MATRDLLIRIVMTVVAVAVLAVGIVAARRLTAPPGDARLAMLLEEAERLRLAADSCATSLSLEEKQFRAYDRVVDSLRVAVRDLETDGVRRTVPADQYGEYLSLFDRYNAAVPEWHARADTLRLRWEACRTIAETHNEVIEAAAARRYRTAPEEGAGGRDLSPPQE
jgi:hypothetical protein